MNEQMNIQERRSSVWTDMGLKRVSWGSIFAGSLIAISCQFVLSLLGMGIGLVSMNPTSDPNVFSGLGIGAVVWWSVSMLISLFVGGWVAGRLAGIPREGEGVLHGVLTWGVVLMASLFLMTTAIGSTLGGIGAIVGNATRTGVQAAPENMRRQAANALSPQNIRQEARNLANTVTARANEATNGQPEAAARATGEKVAQTTGAASLGAFLALIVGALAAAWGGKIGAPQSLLVGPLPTRSTSSTATIGR